MKAETQTLKVLLDTGVVSSSDFLVGDSQEKLLKWRNGSVNTRIAGFKRVELDHNMEQQREKDALFTIGRLARAGRITLYTYSELNVETWRRPKGRNPFMNALDQCTIHHCPAAIERSKFRSTIHINEWLAKGGKSDLKKGLPHSEFSQIPYLNWLASLSSAETEALISHSKMRHLDDFEVASLQDLPWFQNLARALVSPENLPDCFHIWTARRNGLDVFLTLEKKLPLAIAQIRARKKDPIDPGAAVLRPIEFLRMFGVEEIDPVPIQPGHFYTYMEISRMRDQMHGSKRPTTCSAVPNLALQFAPWIRKPS